MSDHSISIVPRQSSYINIVVKVTEILDWLVSKDIVKPTLSNCTLSSKMGYAISEGAKLVTNSPDNLPFGLITNGLEVITEREIFHTGENGVNKCICPSCKENIALDDWDLNPWSTKESDNLECTRCGCEADIQAYKFEPEWGFSNLGFTFWNWPELTDEFVSEFRKRLGCDISIVYTHI